MTILAYLLPFACLVAALFRAPLVALTAAPACALIAASRLGAVDLSSASSPWRLAEAVATMTLALWVAWRYAQQRKAILFVRRSASPMRIMAIAAGLEGLLPPSAETLSVASANRGVLASILVLATTVPDLLALFFWRLPGVWVLVPFQIVGCSLLLGVLLAPERWFGR